MTDGILSEVYIWESFKFNINSEGTVSGDEMRRAERRHREGAGVTVQNNTRTSVRISALIVSEARVRLSVEECRDLTYN